MAKRNAVKKPDLITNKKAKTINAKQKNLVVFLDFFKNKRKKRGIKLLIKYMNSYPPINLITFSKLKDIEFFMFLERYGSVINPT